MLKNIAKTILNLFGIKEGTHEHISALSSLWSLYIILKRYASLVVGKRDNSFRDKSKVLDAYNIVGDDYWAQNCSKSKEFSIVDGTLQHTLPANTYNKIIKERVAELSKYKISSILEVGVGDAITINGIASHLGDNIDYYGIELSLNRIANGIKHLDLNRHSFSFVVGDAKHLPFKDNSFDIVYSSHCLEQIPMDFTFVIDEMCRVSKGIVVLFEPSFELGSLSQKLCMIASDYVRDIKRYVSEHENYTLEKYHLTENTANPLNRTALYKIVVNSKLPASNKVDNNKIGYVCPGCHDDFENENECNMYCSTCNRIYFKYTDIPCLDKDRSEYLEVHS